MSTSYSFVYGNFIEIKGKQKKMKIGIRCCNNKECKLFEKDSSDSFCKNCGEKIKIKNVFEKMPVDADYVYHMLTEKYYEDNNIFNDLEKCYPVPIDSVKTALYVDGASNSISEYFKFDKLKKINKTDLFYRICDLLDKNNIKYKKIYGGFLSYG